MNELAFLAELRSREIEVWAEGEQLRCNAPVGALDSALREELQHRKADIVKLLNTAQALAGQQAAIVPLQPDGTQPPIFAVPGHSGDVFCFRALARHLGSDQPFFGLQPPGLDERRMPLSSVEALAADFAAQILAFWPVGPYVIAGYCAGGTIAFELAQQLARQGAKINFVALFGSPYPTWYRLLPQTRVLLAEQTERLKKHARALIVLSRNELRDYLADRLRQRQSRRETARLAATDPVLIRRAIVESTTLTAVRRYTPEYFDGRLVVFLPNDVWRRAGNRLLRWPAPVAGQVDEHCGPASCDGYSMLLEPHAASFAELFHSMNMEAKGEGGRGMG